MKKDFYEKLQYDFAMIRFLQDEKSYTQEQYDSTILSIKAAREKIRMHSPAFEKRVLLYCIDTLFVILNEGEKQKIFDFTDAIHNIPEIYMQKRNLYSFRKELKGFQKKYGKEYFPFIDKIKPYFSKKAPQNKWTFFSPTSDEEFKKMHPTGYVVLVIIGLVAFLLPFILYGVYLFLNPPIPMDEPISAGIFMIFMLGMVGTFTIGTGLFNIVAAWIHQYLGHLLTAVCWLFGTALTLLSLYLLYSGSN